MYISGILSLTVLQSPLISSIHYIRTLLSITAQNPSVKEQIIRVTWGNIVPASWKGSAPWANIKCWGETPSRRLHLRSCPCESLRDDRHGYRTVQMGYTKRCALDRSCLDTLLTATYWIPVNKMVTVLLHKCEEQVQQSSGVWILFTAWTLKQSIGNCFVWVVKQTIKRKVILVKYYLNVWPRVPKT